MHIHYPSNTTQCRLLQCVYLTFEFGRRAPFTFSLTNVSSWRNISQTCIQLLCIEWYIHEIGSTPQTIIPTLYYILSTCSVPLPKPSVAMEGKVDFWLTMQFVFNVSFNNKLDLKCCSFKQTRGGLEDCVCPRSKHRESIQFIHFLFFTHVFPSNAPCCLLLASFVYQPLVLTTWHLIKSPLTR